MSRKIINTEGPGMVAASARKGGVIAIVAFLVVMAIFWVLAHAH
jgi:hypothetical protein